MNFCSPQAHLLIWSPRSNDKIARKVGFFGLLSMCVEGNGVYIAVCIVLRGMLSGAMHGIALVNTP